jgi:hypothetical protein
MPQIIQQGEPTLAAPVGSFLVSDGPSWTEDIPTYSCLETCAMLFGGETEDYECSTDADFVDNMAWASSWGSGLHCKTSQFGGPDGVAIGEDFKVGTSTDCGSDFCYISTYVGDWCGFNGAGDSENFCHLKPLRKEVTGGNDIDQDGETDKVVEVGIESAAMYDFSISWRNDDGIPVMIVDTVPAEWDVEVLDGIGEFYAAPTWSDDSIHMLDNPGNGLSGISSFATDSDTPNGLGTDGNYLYSGHFISQEVLIYDLDGNFIGGWPTGAPNLQGLTIVGDELAITQDVEILFFEPDTGAYIRTIPNAGGITVEGMTYDGTALWLLADEIIAVDPADGSVITTIPNAAIGEAFGGTGITSGGDGQLVLAGTSGNWWVVSSADGSVPDSGNNGLDMFGLTRGVNGFPNGLNCEIMSANKKDNGKSATKIYCYPETDSGSSGISNMARCHGNRNNSKCRPTSCGALYLNEGAAAYELDEFGEPLVDEFGEWLPPIAKSNQLCLAAVEDINGGGLEYDGTGDEDGDFLSDYDEACVIGTDPCTNDSDGDGVLDNVDVCPLRGDEGYGVDAEGCPIVACTMLDNYDYEWNLLLEGDGTIASGSTIGNVYPAGASATGYLNPEGLVDATATNLDADECVSGYTDSFDYLGSCAVGNCGGNWESFCGGSTSAVGVWTGTLSEGCELSNPDAALPAPATVLQVLKSITGTSPAIAQ